jgi:hypothetical protein
VPVTVNGILIGHGSIFRRQPTLWSAEGQSAPGPDRDDAAVQA